MNKEEIEKVLEELHNVRPEMLNEKASRLFNAIMSIADERDLLRIKVSSRETVANELQQRIDKAIEYIKRDIDNYELCDEDLELLEILKGSDSNE